MNQLYIAADWFDFLISYVKLRLNRTYTNANEFKIFSLAAVLFKDSTLAAKRMANKARL